MICLPGLGESWGHVSRSSSLNGVSQELGSHLLQVTVGLNIPALKSAAIEVSQIQLKCPKMFFIIIFIITIIIITVVVITV